MISSLNSAVDVSRMVEVSMTLAWGTLRKIMEIIILKSFLSFLIRSSALSMTIRISPSMKFSFERTRLKIVMI